MDQIACSRIVALTENENPTTVSKILVFVTVKHYFYSFSNIEMPFLDIESLSLFDLSREERGRGIVFDGIGFGTIDLHRLSQLKHKSHRSCCEAMYGEYIALILKALVHKVVSV